MKAYDFFYGTKSLSDFGMILCNFSSKGLETVQDGAEISFNTISVLGGSKHNLMSASYESCLESSFQICKYSCQDGIKEISETEHRELTKWLSRKKYLKFKLLDENNIDIYHEAVFPSISRIELDGKLMGLELIIQTNRPFALKEPRLITIKNTFANGKHSINDTSHEEGHIYPYTEITVNQSGTLTIYNAIEDRTTSIKNCVAGEVITLEYPVIQSSVSSHNISNDFNYNFFRIANTYDMSRNDLTISIPCTIKLKYSPIVKVGL